MKGRGGITYIPISQWMSVKTSAEYANETELTKRKTKRAIVGTSVELSLGMKKQNSAGCP